MPLTLAASTASAIRAWIRARWPTRESLVIAGALALVFGACYGAFVAIFPAITMDLFGPRQVSGIMGTLYTAAGIGTLAGPTLAGYTTNNINEWPAVWCLFSIGLVLAIIKTPLRYHLHTSDPWWMMLVKWRRRRRAEKDALEAPAE